MWYNILDTRLLHGTQATPQLVQPALDPRTTQMQGAGRKMWVQQQSFRLHNIQLMSLFTLGFDLNIIPNLTYLTYLYDKCTW